LGGDPTLSKTSDKGSIKTTETLAKKAKVSKDTIHKVEIIEIKAPKELKEKIRQGETTINSG